MPPASPDNLGVLAPLCSVFRRYLKSQNLKYTPERADILNAVTEYDGLFEAESILGAMRKRGSVVSKATLYRTVKLLKESGIIEEVLIEGKQSHYQLIYGRNPIDSLVCLRSGQRIDVSSDEFRVLRDKICEQNGWEPVGHRVVIYGISPDN